MTAAGEWRTALEEWAIPPAILEAAPESPWGFSVDLFARRADAALATVTPSVQRALADLPEGGTVLDVGCGGGAASLPLAARAGHLIGVDSAPRMLEEFARRAREAGVRATTVEGAWPAVAAQTPPADVVVCHHVAYNVAELAPFAAALTDHARRLVVLELTREHPLSVLNDLWLQFHGLQRPARPTADDVVAVLREMGLAPQREDWTAPPSTPFASEADLVAWTRRRLCLPAERDAEIAAALAERMVRQPDGTVSQPGRRVVTLWWPGGAAPSAS
jgi:SAM-dependent methyltransferase